MRVSEVHACLKRALIRLQDILHEIGYSEEERVQKINDVHMRIKALLEQLIKDEEERKKRLMKSIESCIKELNNLCSELQLSPFKEEDGCSMLQREKNSRTRLEEMMEHKKKRMEDLKSLIAKDSELCDILCITPFCIDHDAIPSLKQLETYHAYLDELTKEKELLHGEFVGVKKESNVFMG